MIIRFWARSSTCSRSKPTLEPQTASRSRRDWSSCWDCELPPTTKSRVLASAPADDRVQLDRIDLFDWLFARTLEPAALEPSVRPESFRWPPVRIGQRRF